MTTGDVRVIRSADEFAALEGDWNDLIERCPGYFLSQTFAWADTAWRTIGMARHSDLACLALHSEGRLAAVWPLAVGQRRGLSIARPLGFEGEDYCVPLIEPGIMAVARAGLLWQAALTVADYIVLKHVCSDTPLAEVLQTTRQYRIAEKSVPAPYVARADYADWAEYHATVSSQFRAQLRRRRRKLEQQGKVELVREDATGAPALIDWMLNQKRRWLQETENHNDWMDQPEFRELLVALAQRSDTPQGGVALFALKLDGKPLAAYFLAFDPRRVEYYLTAYDDAWSACSPGAVLLEHIVRWAFDRGLDFDFRVGAQPYKFRWAKRVGETVNWDIATGLRGLPALACLRTRMLINETRQKLALGRFLPSDVRTRLRRALRS
jgi:CelD/BcsL family acetyltransferase involved in cellulose biosynthesis